MHRKAERPAFRYCRASPGTYILSAVEIRSETFRSISFSAARKPAPANNAVRAERKSFDAAMFLRVTPIVRRTLPRGRRIVCGRYAFKPMHYALHVYLPFSFCSPMTNKPLHNTNTDTKFAGDLVDADCRASAACGLSSNALQCRGEDPYLCEGSEVWAFDFFQSHLRRGSAPDREQSLGSGANAMILR